jgi:hypothetical protein
MALWGAAGLSLLPTSLTGCRRRATASSSTTGTSGRQADGDSVLARWAELGRIWRELSVHMRGKYEFPEGERKLKTLEPEMARALAALPASRELRTLFEERLDHVRMTHYSAACYVVIVPGPVEGREQVEEQMGDIRRLLADGTLTKETAEKAARVVAIQAQFMTQLNLTFTRHPEWGGDEEMALYSQYKAGGCVPSDAAEDAGRHVVELEADKPGLLTDVDA